MRTEVKVRKELAELVREFTVLDYMIDTKGTNTDKKRLRQLTLKLAEIGKEYRKVSIEKKGETK